jgi:hypothetical protein
MEKNTMKGVFIGAIAIIWLCCFLKFCSNKFVGDNTNKGSGKRTTSGTLAVAKEVTVDTDTKVVNVPASGSFTKPEIIYRDSEIYIPAKVDTDAIIELYYTKRFEQWRYTDSNLQIIGIDTTYKNRVVGRKINYTIFSKEKIITNTVTIKETETVTLEPSTNLKFGFGALVGVGVVGDNTNKGRMNVIAPTVSLGMKKMNLVAGYDLRSKSVLANVNWYINK